MKLILFVVIVCFMLSGCLPTSQKKAVIQKTNKTETNSLKSEGMPSSADINVSKKDLIYHLIIMNINYGVIDMNTVKRVSMNTLYIILKKMIF
ncbi:hypothetical protein NXX47_14675 [Bacteroides fragilis]|nr:hypothetical protein [Bacteroides fragilis]